MSGPLRTVMFGFGRIGAAYADDPKTARHYRYASHAQVLSAHPDFDWQGVVDPCDRALDQARTKWNVPTRSGPFRTSM